VDCQELEVNVYQADQDGEATIEPLAPPVSGLLLSGNQGRNEVRNASLAQAEPSVSERRTVRSRYTVRI